MIHQVRITPLLHVPSLHARPPVTQPPSPSPAAALSLFPTLKSLLWFVSSLLSCDFIFPFLPL